MFLGGRPVGVVGHWKVTTLRAGAVMSRTMSVRLDEELYERLQESAARQGRSLNNYVVWMLRLSEMADASHPIDTDNDPPPKPVTRRVKRRVAVVGPVDPVAIGEDIVARKRHAQQIVDGVVNRKKKGT
jgi:hypothetical protein